MCPGRAPLAALPFLAALPAAANPIELQDVTRAAGLGDVAFRGDTWYSAGVAFVDLDGDGWADLYFGATVGKVDVLCKNRRDGTFACAPAPGAPVNAGDVTAIAAGDYDGDGDLDLYVMRNSANSLLENDGAARFTDVTMRTGTAGDADKPVTATGTFLDHDGDGRLDLYLGHWFASEITREARDQLLRQGEDGRFVDVTTKAGIDDGDRSTLAMLAFDYDRDGRQDIYLTGDFAESQLFHNAGGGRFEDVTARQPAWFPRLVTEGMGIDSADLDGNGFPDLYVTANKFEGGPTGSGLLLNRGDGTFSSEGVALGVNNGFSWGTGLVDLDLDGWTDIVVVTHVVDYYSLYRNLEGRAFAETRFPALQAGTNQCVTVAFADYDNDGRVDLVLHQIDGHRPRLLRNVTKTENHWLQIRLRTGRDELGSRIRVRAGGRTQERELLGQTSKSSQSDRRFTFGLGGADHADVEVQLPDGTTVRADGVQADREIAFDRQGLVLARVAAPSRGCAFDRRGPPAGWLLTGLLWGATLGRRGLRRRPFGSVVAQR